MKKVFISILIFLIALSSCSKKEKDFSTNFFCVEEECETLNLKFEICSRCGHTAITLNNENKDILLVHWDSPYVDFQNREGRITLGAKSFFKDGKTYAEVKLKEYL